MQIITMNFPVSSPLATSVVLALSLALSGCGNTQFLYNRAHWLLDYRINHYLDLNSTQKSAARQEINLWLDWHRRSQLICYAEFIEQFETRSKNALSNADLEWLEAQFGLHYQTVLDKAFDPAAHILSTLDNAQIDHLEKRLQKDHAKLARELKPELAHRQQRRAKKIQRNIKKWFGKLSRAQIAWLSEHSHALPDAYAPWLTYRVQRDNTLIKLLRSQAEPGFITAVIKPMWLNNEASMAIENQSLINNIKAQSRRMAVMFYAMASTKQKTHFWNRLKEYRNDFLQLANIEADASCKIPAIQLAGNGSLK